MQITTGTEWLKLVAATAVIGAIVAGGLSFTVSPHYVSSAAVSVTPQADPVRPTSPQVLQEQAAEHVAAMETSILSRTELWRIIADPQFLLYSDDLRRMPIDDVIQEMRSNIRIQVRPSTDDGLAPIVFSIAFAYPDQAKAQATVRALAQKFTDENVNTNRTNADAYRGFWGDMAEFAHTKPAPPPPVGEIVGVLNPASLPVESEGPNRVIFLAWGLGTGLLLGLLAALAMRWPHGAWKLGRFAVVGCILAGAASFLIPNRYTSTATMMIAPTQVTEDPLIPLPPVTPAAELLRQMEPEVLSFQRLSRIIEDRRINLYPSERATRPMEEVVRNMARDLRIAALDPPSGVKGSVAAFSISFSYSDRFKAQQAVQMVMNAFTERYYTEARLNASKNFTLRNILKRKAGEVLEVLDPPNTPQHLETPNRLLIAAVGLGVGLLLGAIVLFFRRPRAPVLQPAGCTTGS